MTVRIGHGYDAHRMVDGRKLILGGVEISFPKGLHGHSDADVLLHAVCDALLGSLSLGDIGVHFPDHDPQFKGISSLKLLERVRDVVKEDPEAQRVYEDNVCSRFRISIERSFEALKIALGKEPVLSLDAYTPYFA